MTVIKLTSKLSTTTVNTTTTETDLVNFDVPANGLEIAAHSIRVVAAGEFLNNTGGADTVQFRVKLGATTLLATAALSFNASANRRKWRMEIDILAEAEDLQRVSGTLEISDADTDSFADHGTDGQAATGYGTGAEVTSAPLTFKITGQLGTSNALLEVTCTMAQVELIR